MKKHTLLPEREKLLEKINKHLIRGDKGMLAEQTGFSLQYVRKVLSPSFPQYSLRVIDEALKLAEKRELEQAQRSKLYSKLS